MDKYLIINADDFGVNDSVNKAIIDLLNKKRISSATLMPNVKCYDNAARWSKINSYEIGIHMTFVSDNSQTKFKSLSGKKSLENKEGYLEWDLNEFRKNVKFKDMKIEIDKQFEKLFNSDIKISHVDIHRYALYPTYNPIIYIYLLKKCKKNGNLPIRWTRSGTYDVGDQIGHLCDSDKAAKFFAAISDLFKLPIPDYVFKFPYTNSYKNYDEKKKALINMIYKLPVGISEFHIHPAVESEEIKLINSTWEERVSDYKLMLDKDVTVALEKANVKIITYNDISKMKSNPTKIKSITDCLYYGFRYLGKNITQLI